MSKLRWVAPIILPQAMGMANHWHMIRFISQAGPRTVYIIAWWMLVATTEQTMSRCTCQRRQETTHLINVRSFLKMKPTAIRLLGGIIDVRQLLGSVKDGKIVRCIGPCTKSEPLEIRP